jgi:hypothetical protein
VPQIKNLRIYPNPNDGLFYVEAEFERATKADLTLYDLLGNKLLQYKFAKASSLVESIDREDVEPGIYVLCLSTDYGVFSRKIVVN